MSRKAGRKLDRRLADTQKVFVELVAHTGLAEVLGAFSDWAVVGGAVRDVLLAGPSCRHGATPPWQDLDIAVAHESEDALVSAFADASCRWHVQRNSFGGLKVTLPTLGDVDLWVTGKRAPRRGRDRHRYWSHYLNSVDFGINAVAFAWPNRNLVLHNRWKQDLHSGSIDVLSRKSPRKEIQPIRAIALGASLSCRFSSEFSRYAHLGAEVWTELGNLIHVPEMADTAVSYMRGKVASGRWKKEFLLPFLTFLIENHNEVSASKTVDFLKLLLGVIQHEQTLSAGRCSQEIVFPHHDCVTSLLPLLPRHMISYQDQSSLPDESPGRAKSAGKRASGE